MWIPNQAEPQTAVPPIPLAPPAPSAAPRPPASIQNPQTWHPDPRWAQRSHLSVSQRSAPDGYLIEIGLMNIDPARVRITPQGRGLRIQYRSERHDRRQDLDGVGYRRSEVRMTGSASRFVSLPPDANLAAMSQEATPERILLRIPRTPRPSGGPHAAPTWP
jgi:hypothetical protein